MKPAPTSCRIQALDVARGLAVFGILLVNMRFYNTSLHAIQWQVELWPAAWDKAAGAFLRLFVEGKFLSVFSFLFGYSMVILYERAAERGARFVPLFARRLLILGILGLCHALVIWYGDILFHYSVLGLLLLLFHKCRPKTLFAWSILFLALTPSLLLLHGGETGPSAMRNDPELRTWMDQAIASDLAVYGGGTFGAIQQKRMADWIASAFNQLLFYPQILGLFLLGAAFAKQRLLHEPERNAETLRKIATGSGLFGFGLTLLPLWQGDELLEALQILIGAPAVGVCYIITLTLALQREVGRKLLHPLAAVGRLALSNYVGQSVVCTLVFYGYGLGGYGKVGPLAGSLLAILIFSMQLALSNLWLRRFRMGPLEWLWRGATYLSPSPGGSAGRTMRT